MGLYAILIFELSNDHFEVQESKSHMDPQSRPEAYPMHNKVIQAL